MTAILALHCVASGVTKPAKPARRAEMTHAWHDVEPGEGAPETVNAVIEIPRRSRAKYEICKKTGMLTLDRVLYSAVYYPSNYGFIPQTLGDDNDPLDIMVLSQVDVVPLTLMRARVLGVMRMIDGGEGDDKIIAVSPDDISTAHIQSLEQLPPHFTSELEHFFTEYKRLEKKDVRIEGIQDKDTALEIIRRGIAEYRTKYGAKK
jgi:inorganic pyrophosphatase